MGEKRRKLDKGELAEIKEFYDGTRTSVVYLAKLFEVSMGRILWLTDHKNFRKSRMASNNKWKKANMEAVRLINKKASIKWINNNREKLNKIKKEKYWENIEKSRKKARDYHNKNKEREFLFLF